MRLRSADSILLKRCYMEHRPRSVMLLHVTLGIYKVRRFAQNAPLIVPTDLSILLPV